MIYFGALVTELQLSFLSVGLRSGYFYSKTSEIQREPIENLLLGFRVMDKLQYVYKVT